MTSLTTPFPLPSNVAHGLAGAVLNPFDEAAVKLEVLSAFDTQKPPDVLGVFVFGVHRRSRGD